VNPKEKAKELVERFYHSEKAIMGGYGLVPDCYWESAKQCALICVNEMIEEHKLSIIGSESEDYEIERIKYWNEVKKEIEQL
jgi:hypothetical protein